MSQPSLLRWYDLTTAQKQFVGNGCGPAGWKSNILGWLVNKLSLVFTDSCNQHDWHYMRGWNENDRLLADQAFYRHLRREISTRGWWRKPLLHSVAALFYVLVRREGGEHFIYRVDYLTEIGLLELMEDEL